MKLELSFFKKRIRSNYVYLFIMLIVGICSIGLLYHQYMFLKTATARLFELKEDYKVYTGALKKVLNEKTKNSTGVQNDPVKKKRNSK